MELTLSWTELLKRDDIIGGQLLLYEVNYVYRGTIADILIKGETVILCSNNLEQGIPDIENKIKKWKRSIINSFSLNKGMLSPVSDGRFTFAAPNLSFGIICPKGVKDPGPVELKPLKS